MRLSRLIHRLVRHQRWEIGLVRQPIHSFLEHEFVPDVAWMPARDRRQFRADPFLLPLGNRQIVLYEDYDYRTHLGRISAGVADGGQIRELKTDVLPLRCHLAYPFTLQYDGRWLCIPESHQDFEVSVWEMDDGTLTMRKVGTILKGVPAVDSTVFQYDGRWWLACTRQDNRPLEQLHIFHADDLFGKWQPHPKNPVKSDSSCTRPAGTPFLHDGQLYRPAQNCSQRYGAAVAINRIVTLTPDVFEEETVRFVKPIQDGPFPMGIHTISCVGDMTVVDGLRYEFFPSEMLRLAGSKLVPSR
ncbi:MAG: hypothetical protein R3C19_18060 [Planctomycetaceae bacterium]